MNEIQLLCSIVVFIIVPILLFCIFKKREYRTVQEREQAASLLKEEAELLEKQKRKNKASVAIKLMHVLGNKYTLELQNTGGIPLRNVEMELLLADGEDNPFLIPEFEKKFPINRLQVGTVVTLSVTQYASSPSVYNIRVRWTEPNGARVEDQVYVDVSALSA